MDVLLVDDHPLTSLGLASCLEETDCFRVSGQANSLGEAQRFIETLQVPSLVILDIQLGKENGLDFLPFLKDFCQTNDIPKPLVLICSVFDDPFRIQTALKLGASGYVSKNGSKEDLLNAIDSIFRGEIYVTSEHNVRLGEMSDKYTRFTSRELEVLNLLKQNKTNKQIAEAMEISKRTVENHISNIYLKTGVASRWEVMDL